MSNLLDFACEPPQRYMHLIGWQIRGRSLCDDIDIPVSPDGLPIFPEKFPNDPLKPIPDDRIPDALGDRNPQTVPI